MTATPIANGSLTLILAPVSFNRSSFSKLFLIIVITKNFRMFFIQLFLLYRHIEKIDTCRSCTKMAAMLPMTATKMI